MKILIVDDSKAMRMIVMRHLRQAGFGNHALEEASNGVEALTAATNAPPDLILCDWNMPEMNGLEFLKKFRLIIIFGKLLWADKIGQIEHRSVRTSEEIDEIAC